MSGKRRLFEVNNKLSFCEYILKQSNQISLKFIEN